MGDFWELETGNALNFGAGPISNFSRFTLAKSGRGQPHSKTWRKSPRAEKRVSVWECGCPLPLSDGAAESANLCFGLLTPIDAFD
jgi:hypothetical protein